MLVAALADLTADVFVFILQVTYWYDKTSHTVHTRFLARRLVCLFEGAMQLP